MGGDGGAQQIYPGAFSKSSNPMWQGRKCAVLVDTDITFSCQQLDIMSL